MLLEKFIENTFDGDVTFDQVLDNFTTSEISRANGFLMAHGMYLDGIPHPDDDADWARLVKEDQGAHILQAIVSCFD